MANNVLPLSNTGVKYFGPFEVNMFIRAVKMIVAIITCLSIRAVHLKLVDSLETAARVEQLIDCRVVDRVAKRGQQWSIGSGN